MKRAGGWAFGITVGLALSAPSEAHAQCGDLAGIGIFFGAVAGATSTAATSFAAPGIAKAIRPDLVWGAGVGWTFLSSAPSSLATTIVTAVDCPYPETLYLPPVVGLISGVIATSVWASVSEEGEVTAPPIALDMVPLSTPAALVPRRRGERDPMAAQAVVLTARF